jgi:CBS domain-containing protein
MPVVNRAGYLVGILSVDDLERLATRERDALAPPLRDRKIARAPVDALAY